MAPTELGSRNTRTYSNRTESRSSAASKKADSASSTMSIGSFLRGRMMKVFTAVAIVTTLAVLDSEDSANNDDRNNSSSNATTTNFATEIPMACCFTLPYSCGVAEDMSFLTEVSHALNDVADSRPTARWYAKHNGGDDALSMLLRDARSRETLGAAFSNITALAIAEQEASDNMLRPACTGTDCKATPHQPGCAKPSKDAGCRWQALTRGRMDGTIRKAMAVLAEAGVSDDEIEDAIFSLQYAKEEIQRIAHGLESGSIETWLEPTWLEQTRSVAHDVAWPSMAAFATKVWDEVHAVAISVGSGLSASLARVASDISTRLARVAGNISTHLAEGPSAFDVASQSLDFIGEKLALAANGGMVDAFDYSRDVVWAAYAAVHENFFGAKAAAGAATAAPAGAKNEGGVEEMGGGAVKERGFARSVAERFRKMQRQVNIHYSSSSIQPVNIIPRVLRYFCV